MFNRPGKELKERAEEYALWRTMAAAILGAFGSILIVPLCHSAGIAAPVIAVLILAVIVGVPVATYRICKTNALKLYALGQLVDDIQAIREHFLGVEQAQQEPEKEQS